ncbi:MAG: 4-hydroxy-tetrahydrodipicolinate reductase [Myxococcales bacterium]|nr:4-hydroxy-tetrahydrodipicolinate reductase [Myxococcales bacterium]
MKRVAIIGGSGRMGLAIAEVLRGETAPLVCAASIGRDAANLADVLASVDVYIDVSSPAGTLATAQAAAAHGCAAVIGTTGLDVEALTAIERLAAKVPVLVTANFSLGVNTLLALAARAAASLPTWDAEIVEAHHRHKRDAPSGTALALGAAIAEARHWPSTAITAERHGLVGPRPAQEIAIAAVRGGDVIGEHTVMLLGDGERIELSHRATDRRIFARGAVAAAAWLCGRPAGRYTMADVVSLPT